MSSDANCSFCSKADDTIHVICEKRCLICAHCQRSNGIRQLLISCLDRAAAMTTPCDPQCPLCHHTMAPNMVTNIRRARKEQIGQPLRLTSADALLPHPNVLRQMTRRRELKTMRSGGNLMLLQRQQSNVASMLVQSPTQGRLSLAMPNRVNNNNSYNDVQNPKLSRMTSRMSFHNKSSRQVAMGGNDEDEPSPLGDEDSESSDEGEEEDAGVGGGARARTRTVSSFQGTRRGSSFWGGRVQSPSSPKKQAGLGLGGELPLQAQVQQQQAQQQQQLQQADLIAPPPSQVQPAPLPAYTPAMALDLIIDVYIRAWTAYLQDGYEPLSTHLRDSLSRGRMSKNMVDARVKGVLELLTALPPDCAYDPSMRGSHQQQQGQGLGQGQGAAHHKVASPGGMRRSAFHESAASGPSSTAPSPLPVAGHSRPGSSSGAVVGAGGGVLGGYSVVNTHLLLFAQLLGLQPDVQPEVCPMEGYIAVAVLAMAVCERCLRNGKLLTESEDGLGVLQPTAAELGAKLCPTHLGTRQPLTGRKLTSISLKKALSILQCLVTSDESRFNMTALRAACVEYGVSPPWRSKASVSALLHCFLSLNADGKSLLAGNYSSASSQQPQPAGMGAGAGAGAGAGGLGAGMTIPEAPGDSSPVVGSSGLIITTCLSGQDSPSPAAAAASSTFPPLHLLEGAMRRVWEGKLKLPVLTFEMALATCRMRGPAGQQGQGQQFICLPYFASMCVQAWRMELQSVLTVIKFQRQANLRRHGLKPHVRPFEQGAGGLTISHRKALQYIYNTFADRELSTFEATNKMAAGDDDDDELDEQVDSNASSRSRNRRSSRKGGGQQQPGSSTRPPRQVLRRQESLANTMRTGIDWEVVRERASKKGTIGVIPYIQDVAAFLSKSNAELEHLARVVLLQTSQRREWRQLVDGCGWRDEWCWGGISIGHGGGGAGMFRGDDGEDNDDQSEGKDGKEEEGKEESVFESVMESLALLPPCCSASQAARTTRRRQRSHVWPPVPVDSGQWEVLCMKQHQQGLTGGAGVVSIDDVEQRALMKKKLYAVLLKCQGDDHSTSRLIPEQGQEQEQEVLCSHNEEQVVSEDETQEEKGQEHDVNESTDQEAQGLPEEQQKQSLPGGGMSRAPSIKNFIEHDFHTYFRETNTRTLQIQRSFSDCLPPPHVAALGPTRKRKAGQQHYVVCDQLGGHMAEMHASQLFLKQEPHVVARLSSAHLLTPAPRALHLQHCINNNSDSNINNIINNNNSNGNSTNSRAGLQSTSRPESQWDSPWPGRHRVHMADIVSAKKHGDIFVRTGLLRPIHPVAVLPPDQEEGDGSGDYTDLQQQRQQEECVGQEQGHGQEDGEVGGASLQNSVSIPLLRVASSLNQLEFMVPPSSLEQRLKGAPHLRHQGANEEEGGDEMGLVFHTMSPTGGRNRCHIDLGHFTRMRPSEHPQLSSQASLQSLNLADSLLRAPALGALLSSLTRHQLRGKGRRGLVFQELRNIDLSGNKLGDEGARLLSDALSEGCGCLAVVSLRNNQITDAGAVEVLQAVLEGGGGDSLLKLDLGSNLLTLALPRLTELLTHLPRLRVLDLSWNAITLSTFAEKTAARSLVEQCVELQVLSFAYNRVGDAGATVLLRAMETASSLQLVDLAYCFCTEKVVGPLLGLLNQPKESAGVGLVLLHGVALSLVLVEEVVAAAAAGGRRVVLEGHHTGVSINMKY